MTTSAVRRRKPAVIDLGPSDEFLRDEFWAVAHRASAQLDRLIAELPAVPTPIRAEDYELDCFTVATAYTLAKRLGLDAPALTA